MHYRPNQKSPTTGNRRPYEFYSRDNLFICNLSPGVDESALKRIFSAYGEIVSAAVMRNIHTGESLGTAFVRFATTEQAQRAMEALTGSMQEGRAMIVQWAKRQHDDTPVGEARKKIVKLFVRNIPLDVGAEEVRRLFERFGAVESVTLHKDTAAASHADVGQPLRRIAFVTFVAEGVADRAAEAVHNTRPFASHGPVPLMVKLAEDHSERRATAATAAVPGFKPSSLFVPLPRFRGPQLHRKVHPQREQYSEGRRFDTLDSEICCFPVAAPRPPDAIGSVETNELTDVAVDHVAVPKPLLMMSCQADEERPGNHTGVPNSISNESSLASSQPTSAATYKKLRNIRYTHEPYRGVACTVGILPVPSQQIV
ncbi:unnamed protein product [Trypanosoma congolense IL3000]|uniref:WGS project CAEQ00000000 data, annotated contig 1543 n=1 Tax=Trypanosoma congolense (strain IL3000) TaxID=1068625 RepID=F9W701_TRYCI|nr:unnamed protein product [Trypanosoma congolense IL3000]